MHMFSVKVEYYRSFEYSLKWNNPMYPKRSSKWLKTSKDQDSPSSSEESIQRRVRVKRPRAGVKKAQYGDTGVSADKVSVDIIDILDRNCQIKEKTEENGAVLVEVADGVNESDDDQVSVSSVTSGPSVPLDLSAVKPQVLCSACRKVYQKAKRMKAPLKDKLLDKNPRSLTCDQWILIKQCRGRKKHNSKGSLLVNNQMIHNLHLVKNGLKVSDITAAEEQRCTRPHIFLQRNLRHCVKGPLKKERKKNRRKRSREDSEGSPVVKQQRLRNNVYHQPISTSFTHDHSLEPISNHCSSLSLESVSEDTDLTINLTPASVGLKTSDKIKDPIKQNVPKRAGGFKDLLTQLRGNSSIIIRETRY